MTDSRKKMTFTKAIEEIRLVAQGIEGAFGDDETGQRWVKRLREAARVLRIEGPGTRLKAKL